MALPPEPVSGRQPGNRLRISPHDFPYLKSVEYNMPARA
jgi:hypothetical protein